MRFRRPGALLLGLAAASACAPAEPEKGGESVAPGGHGSSAPSAPARGRVTGPTWIDEALCEDCHPSIVESWRSTGMARALEPLRPGELDGLLPVSDPATGLRYHFEESAGVARIVETLADPPKDAASSGQPPHRASSRLAFAVGAGQLDRSYVAVREGRMWFAPVEVVSESDHGPRQAALAPVQEIQPGTRFGMEITSECLGCHTDAPPPRDWPLNVQPPADEWQPRGISCGACHAKALEHVDWREAELAGDGASGEDPLIAAAPRNDVERLSVCAACHLQGDARIELENGHVGPPEPGRDLLAGRAVFVGRETTEEVSFVSHVERLTASPCYLESRSPAAEGGRGLVCETCHDPHRSVYEPRERERVRGACLECHGHESCGLHDAEAKRGKDCVDCHMRKTPVLDVAHVRITDHRILVRPPPPSEPAPLRFAESPTGDWRRFQWPGEPPPGHADDPGLWMMAYASGGYFDRALELVDAEPGPRVKSLAMYHHVRGLVLEGANRAPEAVASYRAALGLDPELAESASNLGLLLGRLGAVEEAFALLSAIVERHPLADGALRNRALVRRAAGDDRGFLEDLERAMELHPDAAVARALSQAYAERDRLDLARKWSDEALRLDPTDPSGSIAPRRE